MDKENAALASEGQTTKPTKFETDKEKLRRDIRAALSVSENYEDFANRLLQRGITVKESRGRLSYLTPDRTKPITARRLGDDFDKAAVLAALEQNAVRAAEQPLAVSEYQPVEQKPLPGRKDAKTAPQQDGIQRIVDREKAREKGIGYDRWAASR